MAAVAAVAMGPTLVAPPAVTIAAPPAQLPVVQIEDIQLAGIGQDFYYAVQPWVGYSVELVQYAVSWIPPLSSQIGILYFAGLQPVVEATVNALAGIVQNPLNTIPTLAAYGATLGVIGANFVAAEAAWFGLPLPPVPPLASRTPRAPRAAAAVAALPAVVAADPTAVRPAPARAGRGELRRATRSAAARSVPAEVRGTARATRAKAAGQVRAAVHAAADAAS